MIAVAGGVIGLAAGVLVAGAAAGLAFPPYADLVARTVAPQRRPVAWSAISSGTGWGVAVAGPVAIVFGDRWRAAWLAFAALAVVAGVSPSAPRRPAAAGHRPRSNFFSSPTPSNHPGDRASRPLRSFAFLIDRQLGLVGLQSRPASSRPGRRPGERGAPAAPAECSPRRPERSQPGPDCGRAISPPVRHWRCSRGRWASPPATLVRCSSRARCSASPTAASSPSRVSGTPTSSPTTSAPRGGGTRPSPSVHDHRARRRRRHDPQPREPPPGRSGRHHRPRRSPSPPQGRPAG